MVRRKEKSELEQAEIKLESLIQRRDALNAQAAVSREERDLLHFYGDRYQAYRNQVSMLIPRRPNRGAEQPVKSPG